MSKKLIIAISALALAIIAGVVAVVGVFAAQQQKVANTFTITYTANNVDAGVRFYVRDSKSSTVYEYPESSMDNQNPFHNISASQEEKTNAFELQDFNLTADNSHVFIVLTFKNNVSSGGKSMKFTFSNTAATQKNVNCYYSYTSGGYLPNLRLDTNKELPAEKILAPQEQAELYILIEIADLTLDAEFISTADAGIGFTLESV